MANKHPLIGRRVLWQNDKGFMSPPGVIVAVQLFGNGDIHKVSVRDDVDPIAGTAGETMEMYPGELKVIHPIPLAEWLVQEEFFESLDKDAEEVRGG